MSGPWERFAPAEAQQQEAGPWTRFADVPGISVDDGGTPKPQPAKPSFDIDFTAEPKQVRAAIKALPEDQRKAATQEWAKVRVGSERAAGNKPDVMYNLAAGTPIGSWLDEGEGALQSTLYSLSGGRMGAPYDETVAIERERQKQAEDNSTKLGELPYIGDVRMSGVQKVLGGIASAPVTPLVSLFRGASMLPAMGNALATGIGYGALYGAGEGDSAGERAGNAAIGAGVGGALGSAAVPVARGIGNAANALMHLFQPTPQPLRQFSRPAVNRVADGAAADNMEAVITGQREQDQIARAVARGRSPDGMTVERIRRANPYLGDEGMLLDTGPNLRGQANAIANQPGEGMSTIRTALEERRMDAPSRINIDLNSALMTEGPGGTTQYLTPAHFRQVVAEANQRARPFYEAAYDTQIRVDENLAPLIQRAQAAPGVMQEAQRLMILDGIDPNNPRSNVQFIDYIKRGLDDLARGSDRGTNAERLYGNLARQIRDGLDQAIMAAGGVAEHPITRRPSSVYAIARDLAADGKQLREAAELGAEAATKGKTADEVAIELGGLSREAAEAYRLSYRTELRRSSMQSGTSFTDTGDTAIRKSLNNLDAREKLRLIAPNQPPSGPGQMAPTDRLLNRIDAENTFAKSENEVTGSSATAFRTAAQKMYPPPSDASNVGAGLRKSSLSGMVMEGAYRIGNALTGGAINERRMQIAADAARMLTAQGVERDQIAQALIQYMRGRNVSRQGAQQIQQFIETLTGATRAPLIDQATPASSR